MGSKPAEEAKPTTDSGEVQQKAEEGAPNPALKRDGAEDTLVIGTSEAKGIFNPIYYSSSYDGYVVDMIFKGLIERDIDGQWQPALAESWKISDDGLTYSFKLKEGVVFSDGSPVTANDVAFTFKAIADPSYDGRYQSVVQDMVGFDQYFGGDEN